MPRRSRRAALSVGHRPGRLLPGEKPLQRNAANARERARMRVLSKAFCRLKTTLPWVPPDTKLSKLDTLRLATSYIAHLRGMVSTEDAALGMLDAVVAADAHPHPTTLTWPYSFPRAAPGNQKSHFEHHAILPDDDEDEEEDDEDEQWSQCSSQDSSPHAPSNSSSFLTHFTDVLMDIS